jgi:hypothetical protein
VGVFALSGCGGIDSGQVEAEIAKDIEAEIGVRVASVECPDEIEKKEGLTVQCTARGENGGEAVVDVTQIDDEGSVQFRARDLSPLAP